MTTIDFEKMQKLRSIILTMQKEISDRIYYLNNGGCVHFAYFFSKELEKHKIKHKVYFLDYYNTPVNVTQPPSHIVVKIDNVGIIDGYTLNKSFVYYRKQYKEDLSKIRKAKGWNPFYDKRQNITLRSIIIKHLNDY